MDANDEVNVILFQHQVDQLYSLVKSQSYFVDDYDDVLIVLDLYRSR